MSTRSVLTNCIVKLLMLNTKNTKSYIMLLKILNCCLTFLFQSSGLRQHGQRQGEEADQSKQPQKALQQITGPFPG